MGQDPRNMYPGYKGFRPRLQLSHADADAVLSPVNQTESIKQWTNVMGLDSEATTTTTETIDDSQYSREQWLDACGNLILAGAGGAGTQAGGTAAAPAGGTSAEGAGGTTDRQLSTNPKKESLGCNWDGRKSSPPAHGLALALAGLFVALFARRRTRRSVRVG